MVLQSAGKVNEQSRRFTSTHDIRDLGNWRLDEGQTEWKVLELILQTFMTAETMV